MSEFSEVVYREVKQNVFTGASIKNDVSNINVSVIIEYLLTNMFL